MWLGWLHDESLVDVWDNTAAGDGGLDEGIKFLVTTNGKLQMSWGDSLDFQVLGSVACELEDLSGQVLKDGSRVDS